MSINETNPHQDDENNKFYLETLTDEELSAKSHKYIPGDPTPILLHLLKYPEEATNEFLIKYPKIWKRWARKETFDSFEQTKITKELTAIADFWKTQIVDRSDPQDDGLVNYAWAKNILLSRQKSIDQGAPKLMMPGKDIDESIRNDILKGYAKRNIPTEHPLPNPRHHPIPPQ